MKNLNKKELYAKVENIKSIFNDIDKLSILKSDEERENFIKINKNLDNWLDRLKDERFKIALIGTTSAGKSTFANALLENDLLPEDDKTTTFTSASIESSNEDKVVIEFYSKTEFEDKFKNLLDYLKIEDESFDTINDYKIVELLKEEWQKNSSQASEIKDILKDRNIIKNYLDKSTIALNTVTKEVINDYITKPEIARAVRKITIYSTKFQGMRDLIIYDVPGFDSPTQLHKEQAEKFMKDSEIVVLVHGYGASSDLNESQVNMLRATKDEFGSILANKMIVVGNKIDKEIPNSQPQADEKIKKLSDDLTNSLKKYNIYRNKNFIPVSAKAYLEEKGVIEGSEISAKLKKLNISNGFSEFKNRLEEMLNDDALEVLNRIVDKVLSEATDILKGFAKDYNPKFDEDKKRIDEISLVDAQWVRIKNHLKFELPKLKNKIRDKNYNINENIIKQVKLEWIGKIKENVKTDLEFEKNNITSGKDSIISATTLNDKVRETIYKKSLEDIIRISTDVIEKDTKNEVESIFKILKEVIYENKNIYEEVLNQLINIFDEITTPYQYEKNSYKPLINRFLNSIFEVIVLARVGSEARKNKFKNYEDNILGLLHLTGNYNDIKGNFEQNIIQNILIQQENIKLSGNAFEDLLNFLKVANTEDEVEKEIVYDLEKLEELFGSLVIKSAQIETPFKDSLQDQIQALLSEIESDDMNNSKLRRFIVQNIRNISPDLYFNLEIDEELKAKISAIIVKIDEAYN